MAETTEQYRTRINQLKTSIENEPYMKNMRPDIAEGISKTGNRQADIEVRQDTLEDDFVAVQKDASSASPSGAEVAVARGSYPTLDQRLTIKEQEVDAQFSQTMTQTEFDSWVATLLDGGPSIFMDSLAALNLAYPTGASGVALVRETDPAKIYVWNGTGWQLFGDYQGLEIKDDSVTTEKLTDSNVTMVKTDFIAPSENLFNFADIKLSGYYANDGSFILSDTFGSTGFIKVAGGKTYQTDIGLINDYYGDVVFWQDKQTKLSSINSGTWNSTIATPTNTKYVTIPLRKSKDSDFGMFIEGSELPQSFVPYQGELSDKIKVKGSSLVDFSVGYDELEFIHVDENLFDKDNPIVGGYFDSNGTWGSTELYNSSNFMKVKSGASYYADFPNFYDVCFFDEFKRPIKGVGIQAGLWKNIISVPYVKQIKYMTIPYSTSYTEGDIQVRTGTSAPLDFMEYGRKDILFKDGTINSKSLGSLIGDKITKDMDMLVFGDSVSETATMNDDGTNYVEGGTGGQLSNWPTYAKDILETSSLVNYAKSGARYKDTSTSDLRVKLSHQISTAIAGGTTADIIVVSAGTNDGIENLGDFSTAMAKTSLESLDRLKLYEAVRWAFWTLRLNYPGAQFFAALPIQRADQETPKELIDCIVKMANRYNFYVIDANSESGIVRDFENISAEGRDLADGLHPNTKGKIKMGLLYARDILLAVQQDVSSASLSVSEVSDARGGYSTLGDRLAQEEQNVIAQLEENDFSIQSLANQVGELAATSTFKGSATNAVIIAKTGMNVGDEWFDLTNNQSLRWNGSSWVNVGASLKLGTKSVVPENTSFFEKGKNEFDKTKTKVGYYVNQASGVLTSNPAHKATDYIEGYPSKKIIFNQPVQRYAFYDVNKAFISGGLNAFTVTYPTNASLLVASSDSWNLETLQAEQGTVTTSYEPYQTVIPQRFLGYKPEVKAVIPPFVGDTNKEYRVIGANIRTPLVVGGAYSLLNDAGHEPMGITSVTIVGDELRVGMNFTAKKVISMSIMPHVSLMQEGYSVATTGGLSVHAVYFYKNGVMVPAKDVVINGGSFWFSGTFLV